MTIIHADKWRTWTSTHGLVYLHVVCPQCGHDCPTRIDDYQAADEGHRVDPAGNVQPSMVCPYAGCDFHDYCVLEDWRTNSG